MECCHAGYAHPALAGLGGYPLLPYGLSYGIIKAKVAEKINNKKMKFYHIHVSKETHRKLNKMAKKRRVSMKAVVDALVAKARV